MARLIAEFESSFLGAAKQTNTGRHHEQVPGVQSCFVNHVNSMASTIEEMGNPFIDESSILTILDTKYAMNDDVVQAINTVEETGILQYESY